MEDRGAPLSELESLLEQPDFDLEAYLNATFSDEGSLKLVPKIKQHVIARLEKAQEQSVEQKACFSISVIPQLRDRLLGLNQGLERLQARIEQTLRILLESEEQMCLLVEPISKLDAKKKELVAQITKIQRFQMLQQSLARLQSLVAERNYRQIAPCLLAAQQLTAQFEAKGAISSQENHDESAKIKSIYDQTLRKIHSLQKDLRKQIFSLYESGLGPRGVLLVKPMQLAEACLVIEVLGNGAQQQLVHWYCDRQLRDYKAVFRGNLDLSSIESIPKRFAWLKRLLSTFDREHHVVFPLEWFVKEALCIHFCAITSKDLSEIMAKTETSINSELLLAAIKETQAFEKYLQNTCLADRIRARDDLKNEAKPISFSSAQLLSLSISQCFEPFLFRFVEAEEQIISKFIDKLPTSIGSPADLDPTGKLLASAGELFLLFRDQIIEIASLSTRKPMIDLAGLFNQYLLAYAKYLQARYPTKAVATSYSKKNTGNANTNFDLRLVCLLINSADYCMLTMGYLHEHVCQIVEGSSAEAISFEAAKQSFHVTISLGISMIEAYIANVIEPSWVAMKKVAWANLPATGDQSAYIGSLVSLLCGVVPVIRNTLVNKAIDSEVCERAIKLIYCRFKETIYELKRIGETGAEQLLVDIQGVRKTLLQLKPSEHPITKDNYTKNIANGEHYANDGNFTTDKHCFNTAMSKSIPYSDLDKLIDRLHGGLEGQIKCLLFPLDPPTQFVEKYLLLLGDIRVSQFRRILDLRGLSRKSEQIYLVDEFIKLAPETPSGSHITNQESDGAIDGTGKWGAATANAGTKPATTQPVMRFQLNDQLRRIMLTIKPEKHSSSSVYRSSKDGQN